MATEALFMRPCTGWRITRSFSIATGGGHLRWSPDSSPSHATRPEPNPGALATILRGHLKTSDARGRKRRELSGAEDSPLQCDPPQKFFWLANFFGAAGV